MASFKEQGFQDRIALAAKAKQAALDKLKAKPPVDEAVLAERRAAAEAREQAQAAARAEKLAAREAEKAEKAARKAREAEEAAAAKAEAEKGKPAAKQLTEEEAKALRDAKYAARKKRLGKR